MKKRIFIIGHFGGYNAGDEAMLGGFLSTLPSDYEVWIKYKNNININWGENRNIFSGSYLEFVKLVEKGDSFVLCGGTHFHDDYKFSRLLRHWIYLTRIIFLFRQSRKKQAKNICIGNGFSPVSHPLTKSLIKIFTALCDIVTVRDKASYDILKQLKCKADLQHSDMAMLLYNPAKVINKQAMIGVSLTSLKAQKTNYITDEELVRNVYNAFVSFQSQLPELIVKLFVIRAGDRESDYEITSMLQKSLNEKNIQTEIYSFNNDLNELIEEMEPCELFIASRFHSAVLATVTKNKLIILSYHQKLVSFGKEVLLDNSCIYDLQSSDIKNSLTLLGDGIAKVYNGSGVNYTFPEKEIEKLGVQIQSYL